MPVALGARYVRGDGPPRARLMAIGEAPGKWENKNGVPFVGRAGEILDLYLRMASISRASVYVTNLVKYWPGRNKADKDVAPTAADIRRDVPALIAEMRAVRPEIILTLGAVSTRWFLGNVPLEVAHGIPRPTRWGTVIAGYHPAAGFYDPEVAAACAYDIRQAALALAGRIPLNPAADAFPKPIYRLVRRAHITASPCAVDTEGTAEKPAFISWCARPGEAFVMSAADVRAGRLTIASGVKIVFHSAMYDLEVTRAMGLDLGAHAFDDTAVGAYLLRVEPKGGLKPLALRHCGMVMADFADVIRPHFTRAAEDWLFVAGGLDWGKAPEILVLDAKTRKWRISQPRSLNSRIKSLIAMGRKKPGTRVDKLWAGIPWELREKCEEITTRVKGPFPEFSVSVAPLAEVVPYAARDADATLRLRRALRPRLKALSLDGIRRLDLGAVPMFSRMQQNGIRADREWFASVRPGIAADIAERTYAIRRRFNIPESVNLNAPPQLARLLFGMLKLPVTALTAKGAPSTASAALEAIRDKHPIVEEVLDLKEATTNISFIDRIPRHISPIDDRVRCTIRNTQTETGRASTSEPNMMGVPTRTEAGKQVRRGFIPRDGYVLFSTDLSQIELRVMAHVSGDKNMTRAYRDGVDIHAQTAALIFGVPIEKLDKLLHRYPAKTMNFLILYGGGPERLMAQCTLAGVKGYDLEDYARFIARWYDAYSGVPDYMECQYAEGRRLGFVRDMFGRIRFLPNLQAHRGPLRSQAERHAGNFPIQSGAQGIIKRAMARIWKWLVRDCWPAGIDIQPLLQIHDEILFEVPEEYADVVKPVIRELMCADSEWFNVPIEASCAYGARWGDLKD